MGFLRFSLGGTHVKLQILRFKRDIEIIFTLTLALILKNFNRLFLTIVLLLPNLPIWSKLEEESLFMLTYSNLGVSLIFLSIWVSILIIFSSFIRVKKSDLFIICLISLNLVLVCTFLINRYVLFYLFFEISLIPIYLMIMVWGYQPERLIASNNLILYTLVASLPLLIIMLWLFFVLKLERFIFF